MKRRTAERVPWPRVTGRHFSVAPLEEPAFSGYVSLLQMLEVREPLVVEYGSEQVCVADGGFSWLQHFPRGANHTLTTMFNADGRVVQWYIDICKEHGLNEQGVPWYDDLYLDVVVLPDGRRFLLDADELDDALRVGAISQEDHDLAWREAKSIFQALERGDYGLLALSEEHRRALF